MIAVKKRFSFIIAFIVATVFLSAHLLVASGSEVYITSSEDSRFAYCENSDGTIKIMASSGASFADEFTLPSELDGKTVSAVSERGFIGQKQLTSLIIPESISSIGESAFSNCSLLKKVTVKGTITNMGLYPFFATPFEDTLEKKGHFIIFDDDILYDYTGNDYNIAIPNGIRVISGTLFTYLEAERNFEITTVSIPDSVEYICDKAFYDCNNITMASFGAGIKYIGINAFTAAGMTIMGYYETYAQTYAENSVFDFEPIVPYGEVSETIYADFNDGFRQFYFTDEDVFSRENVLVYRRNYNGEKIEITDWEYSATIDEIYNN